MINTGSEYLDQFVKYKGMTIIYGEAATGKTTIAMLAALEQLRNGKKVVYLDTEGGFSIERIKQLAQDYESILGNLRYKHIKNFFKQNEAIRKVYDLKDIDLVIIDTIGFHFRTEVSKDPEKHNRLLRWQIETLRKISKELPVIITNQVYQNIENGKTKMTADKILRPWADQILQLEKEPRKIIRERPENEPVPFKIIEEGITF